MGMVMYTAGAEIKQVGINDQNDTGDQQPGFITDKELF
jgi:hypothetical protein